VPIVVTNRSVPIVDRCLANAGILFARAETSLTRADIPSVAVRSRGCSLQLNGFWKHASVIWQPVAEICPHGMVMCRLHKRIGIHPDLAMNHG